MVVTASDDEADAPDSVVWPPDSSSVECSAEVVDVGLANDELDADDVGVDDSFDAEEGAVGFDSDAVELEEADDEESSAQATPGVVATAPLTPSATASAPTRPMYFAYVVGLDSEFSEFAARRLTVGPSRLLSRGDRAVAKSGSARKRSLATCFPSGSYVAGIMTPLGSGEIATNLTRSL